MLEDATEISLESRQTELVYEKTVTCAVFGVLVAVVVAVSSYLVESGLSGFFWLLGALGVFCSYLLLADRYFSDEHRHARNSVWHFRILLLTIVCGCVWGAAAWCLFDSENVVFQFFLYTILASVAAVSVSALSSRFDIFAGFVLPLLGLVALQALVQGEIFTIFAVFISLLTMVLLRVSLVYNKDIGSMCLLGAKTTTLQDEVDSLSDSSASMAKRESVTRSVLEDAGIYLWEVDSDLRITRTSRRFRELTGLQSSELSGKLLMDFIEPDSANDAGYIDLEMALSRRKGVRDVDCTVALSHGTQLLIQVSARPTKDEDGQFNGFEGYFRDVTASGTVIRQLTFQTQHDPLTGFINRSEFLQRVSVYVPPVNLKALVPHVIYIDVRNLKLANDTLGLASGDEMFVQLAEVLRESVGDQATISRLGGGAFGILLSPGELAEALQIATLAIESLNAHRYTKNDLTFSVQARAGVAGVTPQMETAEVVLNCAHIACRDIEENERNPIGVYRAETAKTSVENSSESLAELMSSLENRSLCVLYQPVKSIETNETHWIEALLAKKLPGGSVELVGQRLAEALKHGVVVRFDRWVIDNVLREISSARHAFNCGVVINLTAPSMLDRQFPNYVFERLEKYDVDPGKVCFDVTIGDEVSDYQLAAENMQRLVAKGCKLSLDDFGTASCSLETLKHLPASFVKINHVYLENLVTDATDQLVCHSIVQLARSKNCEVIAESVQDKTILPLLSKLGVTMAQGYALGEPARLAEACGIDLENRDIDDPGYAPGTSASNVVALPQLHRRSKTG